MLLKEQIEKDLKKRRKELSHEIERISKDLKYLDSLKSVDELKIKVIIKSSWPEQENIAYTGKGGLEAVVEAAIKKFKKRNHRSDVQGRYYVFAVFPNGTELLIDEEFYAEIKALDGG